MVVEHADVVGFMNYVTTIRKEKAGYNKETAKASGAGLRTLYLTERPAFTAKNRFDMPDSVLIKRGEGYAALAPYLPGHRGAAARANADLITTTASLKEHDMASLGATYDASQGEQMSDRSVLPPGEYLAAIAKSDVSDPRKRRRAQDRPRVRGPRRRAQGPAVLDHAEPLEPEPGGGGDRPARAELASATRSASCGSPTRRNCTASR